MKVMTILGTRPEIIKLSPTLKELDRYTNHIIVHTGQNFDYELNDIFFRDLGLRKPDYFLDAAGQTPAETIGNVIAKSDDVMAREKPDALLLYGDTNSCLAVIAAKRRQIPVFHMEAGNRCFDERVPEEINRKVVDHLSDVNMVLTEHARRYLEREGIPPERIVKVGSSMREVLTAGMDKITASDILKRLNLNPKQYFVVSAHREEVVDTPAHIRDLIQSLNTLIKQYDIPIVFSTHPRTRKRLEAMSDLHPDPRILFSKPFGFFDYVALQQNAFCVLSDSGTITEESAILGFPAVTLRNVHERPEGNDAGTLIMCGYRPERVLTAVQTVTDQVRRHPERRVVSDYEVDRVSEKVVRLILGYTDYVNEKVWFKQKTDK